MTTFATQATTALEEALRLVAHDYALTPVTITREASGKKRARFHRGWRHEQAWSRDPDQIRAWWVDHPDTSFALGCAANGIEGVDLDVKPAEGIDAVSSWAERGLPLGRLCQNTPSGGLHTIWKVRRDGLALPQEAGKTLGRGVDTRNRSGLFFAAGAYILGEPGNYELTGALPRRDELTETPDEVIALFADAATVERVERPADGRVVYHELEWQQRMVAAALAAVRGHPRGEGGYRKKLQHAGLFLGRIVDQGLLTPGEAMSRLTRAHMAVWGPAIWPENVKDIRDALADGPRLERWRAPNQPADPPAVEEPETQASQVSTENAGVPENDEDPAPLDDDQVDDDELARRVFEREVAHKVRQLRVTAEAKRRHLAEYGPPTAPPGTVSLRALLAEPRNATKYRVEGLWPAGGKIMLTAQKKSGKTTMVGNLLRCLVDGDPFLARTAPYRPGEWRTERGGGYAVSEPTGRPVVLLDFEMTHDMLAEWLEDQRIVHVDDVHVQLMRGRLWDIRDDDVLRQWADYLRSIDAGTLLVDPIGPVMGALGINENDNSEVNHYLSALDRLAREAGLDEHGIIHHAGHGEEQRARGASAFLGWPDAIWQLTRDGEARFLSAEGRDVMLPETALTFDRSTRRLSLGDGNRASARDAEHADTIVGIVEESPGITWNSLKRAVREAVGCGTPAAEGAIAAARRAGVIHTHAGANRALLHYAKSRCDNNQCVTPSDP